MNLVERGTEHSIMESMLDACADGHGGVLLVSGAVASGKTALLRSFGERATAAGALYLQATASKAESGQPFGVMGQLLLGAGLPGAETRRAARLIGAGGEPRGWSESADAPAAEASQVISGLCGIVLEKARESVVVLGIDDVHHADERSLEFLLYLARRLDFGRILVVLAENSSFPSAQTRLHVDLLRLSGCRNIRLAPLQRQGVAEMIHETGEPGWRTRKLVSQVHRAGGGSPLLTRALIEDHRSSGATGADGADLVPGEAFARAVVTAQYRSDTATRQVAGALAVAGPDVSLAELVEVLGGTRESAHRSLRALNEAGLLDAGWFRHEAGRAAVLRSMDPADRTRLEARLAQVLHEHGAAASVVVRHLIAAQKVDAPWALRTLIEAAGRALADDEVGLALTCLRVARDSRTDARQALEIRAALTRAGWRVNPAGVAQHLPELTAAALDGRLGPRQADELAGHLLWFGQVERALEVLRTAERHSADPLARPGAAVPSHEQDGPCRWMAYAYPGLAPAARARAAGAPRHETPQDAAQAAPRPRTPEHAPAAHGTAEHAALRHARSRGRGPHQRAATLTRALLAGADGEAVVRAEQILQSTRLGDRTLTALLLALDALVLADRLDRAAHWCATLGQEAAARRAPMWQALLASARARVEARAGALVTAEESVRSALAMVPADGWGVAVVSPLATSVSVLTARGRLDEAAARLSVPVPDPAFQTPAGLLYLRARGQHYLAAGRPYAALDDFLTIGDLMARWEYDLPALVPWRTDAAEAHLRLGEPDRARALAEEQLALAGRGKGWARATSLRALANTLGAERRPPLLDEAIEILRERGCRLDLGRALEESARAQRELGKSGQARALARKAQQLAGECGVPVPGAARTAGAGGPPPAAQPWPPGARRHPDELSNAELRVAVLAVHGLTNRQIADKLCITVSTVEQHLTRAYRKLAVQRREDLAAKLGPAHEGCDRLHVG
ncbi:helix-turn-helix transcriptional regulator [Streptomyces flavofungini]|uniref:helix-turn-helix transcriptional regulator n=1 Tax=Streptomyces flavofungini TaxID=68200 RepID=UPI0034DE4D51